MTTREELIAELERAANVIELLLLSADGAPTSEDELADAEDVLDRLRQIVAAG